MGITVTLNGKEIADSTNAKLANWQNALQHDLRNSRRRRQRKGVVKFRKVEIKSP